MMITRGRASWLFAAATLMLACKSPMASSSSPTATTMSIIRAGDAALVDTVTRDVGLVALVTNASTHAPVSGVRVTWRVVSQQDGRVDTGSTLTNASGVARQTWTLGPVATTQTVVARAVDAATGDSLAQTPFAIAAVADSFSYFSLDATAIQVGVNQKVDVRERIGQGFDRNHNLVVSPPRISITADPNWVLVGDSAYSPVATHGVIRYSASDWSGQVAATATPPVDSLSGTPWLLEDFAGYTGTANLLADPRGIYSVTEDESPSQVFLDNSVGYGSSKQSMRYDYPDRTSEGGSGTSGRCTDFTVGRNIALPAPTTEVWVEVEAKFSSGFTTVAPSSWGCTSAAAYKFLFARTPTGRFNLVLGIFGADYTFGWPANQEPADLAMPFTPFDSRWHVYRMHFKVSTPAGSGNANGACELWVDGVLVKSFQGIVETNPYIYGLAIGRNMNQGPAAPESIWWGRIAAYKTNPGW